MAAAPIAAGVIGQPTVLWRVLIAGIAFTLASSAVYLVNDLLDLELDRSHPTKRHRPLASGALPVRVAKAAAPILAVLAVAVAAICNVALAFLIVIYLISSLLYCVRLKQVAVLELGFVVAGFLLRAIAGGIASGVPLSRWFLLTTGLGALFVIAGKRYAELVLTERGLTSGRPVLREYTVNHLRFVWTVSAGALLVTYSLWAFSVGSIGDDSVWSELSIFPFAMMLLQYALIIDQGGAGEPEEILFSNRALLGTSACWLGALACAVYL